MIDLASFFKEKQVPDWFKKHEIFTEVKQVNKIFPAIGLNNFEVESDIECNASITPFIRNLLYDMYDYLHAPRYNVSRAIFKDNEQNNVLHIIDVFLSQIKKHSAFFNSFKTKKGLYLYADILDSKKKIFAKKNESLFKVYNKLIALIEDNYKIKCTKLDNLPGFKAYSANNITGKLRIVFSSDGNEGAWDILTMSMRGIISCQSWHGQYKQCTIGSVLDPFTGIMYLTSGNKSTHGSNMIRRCVVRFVVDSTIKKPCIFLEYMYPSDHKETMAVFKKAIQDKIGDKFPIITKHSGVSKYYVPYNDMTTTLVKYSKGVSINAHGHQNQGILPYRDCFMKYKTLPDASSISKLKITKLHDKYLTAICHDLEKLKLKSSYIGIYKSFIKDHIFNKIDYKKYTDINKYTRDVCHYYFNNKSQIEKLLSTEVSKLKKQKQDQTPFKKGIKLGKVSIATIVSKTLSPALSDTFKAGWQKSIAASNKTSKQMLAFNI